MEPRLIAAVALIVVSGISAMSALAVYIPRRRRERLRRRGIKNHRA